MKIFCSKLICFCLCVCLFVSLFHPAQLRAQESATTEQSTLHVPVADYPMPIPPSYSCGNAPELSSIGVAVQGVISNTLLSRHTLCNRVTGDWIIDVPNVSPQTPATTAADFYQSIANMLMETEETFSLATLWFRTHDERDELNLVRHYLTPAIRTLHDNAPVDGPYPLLRFAYAGPPLGIGDLLFSVDSVDEVYADLTAALPIPEEESWRVSIAVSYVGQIISPPWNHSKIAVRDYRHAIVGGMNWDLDHVLPVDIDADGVYTDTVEQSGEQLTVHPLYDLSLRVEGEAARATGLYFDQLWRRTISNLLPHRHQHCLVSWPLQASWTHDCSLENVPVYATANVTSTIEISSTHHIFSLGRGHTEWWTPIDPSQKEFSADEALLAAMNQTETTLYISQHQLSGLGGAVEEVIDTIVAAIVDRDVQAKIIISEPWGSTSAEPIEEIFALLDERLHRYAQQQYGIGPPAQANRINDALCRFEVAPFRAPLYSVEESANHLFHTHNKLIILDEMAFYVGSQNLYPSAIGDTIHPELNEYGYLVDDQLLTQQLLSEYWTPIWQRSAEENRLMRSQFLPAEWICNPLRLFLPLIALTP